MQRCRRPTTATRKKMIRRHLLSLAAIAGTVALTSGCVATASDGYYGDSGYGGYGYGYSRPAETVYYQNDTYYSRPGNTIYVENDRYYRDRDRERDRDRQARERERERDRQARERERDQRNRDADRRRDLERQARERDRNNRDRNQGGLFGRSSSHQAECDRYANQVRSGGDIVNTPSRPC